MHSAISASCHDAEACFILTLPLPPHFHLVVIVNPSNKPFQTLNRETEDASVILRRPESPVLVVSRQTYGKGCLVGCRWPKRMQLATTPANK